MAVSCQTYHSRGLGYSLAFHCAPALEGAKVANLVCLRPDMFQDFPKSLVHCARQLAPQGIRFSSLGSFGGRVLLLVYREKLLREHLDRPCNRRLLTQCGYPEGGTTQELLRTLSRRLREQNGEYPHEIGVFLGYPHKDVHGFIRHRGAGYKLAGYWKVYGNSRHARKLFGTYDALRRHYCHRVLSGEEIQDITAACGAAGQADPVVAASYIG